MEKETCLIDRSTLEEGLAAIDDAITTMLLAAEGVEEGKWTDADFLQYPARKLAVFKVRLGAEMGGI